MRRADVLAAGQGRAALRRRDPPRRRRPRRRTRSRGSSDLVATSTASRSRGWAITPTRWRPTRPRREVCVDAPAQGDRRRARCWASAWSTRSSAATRRSRSRPTGRGSWRSGGRWSPYAEEREVRIGIENCPMLFTRDEWPGGKNLATRPAIWRRMFDDIPSPNFGLNFDPSHFVWQQMDYLAPLREFRERIFHVHAKDARIDRDRARRRGRPGDPLKLGTRPSCPGLGDVDWGRFFSALSRHRLRRPRLHRGRGPRLRGLARGAQAGAAPVAALSEELRLTAIRAAPRPRRACESRRAHVR